MLPISVGAILVPRKSNTASSKNSSLYQLCRHVRLFFSRPSPSDEEGTVTTPLHLAAYFGHRDALLILVAKFRNVEVLDGRGRSPLYLASYAGEQRKSWI
jgi:hypothetical protein